MASKKELSFLLRNTLAENLIKQKMNSETVACRSETSFTRYPRCFNFLHTYLAKSEIFWDMHGSSILRYT